MSRTISTCPTAPPLNDPDSHFPDRKVKRYDFEVVTPLFGGGSETRNNDPLAATLIRPSSVRGHLRFWWRAVKGAAFANAEAMRKAEAEIWGSSKNKGKIELDIQVADGGRPFDPQAVPLDLVYAVFPFREERRVPAASGRSGVKFKLLIRYADAFADDVESTLLAWANFGGIGARTRRGCGSLYCSELAPDSGKDADIKKKLGSLFQAPPAALLEWPLLSGSRLLAKQLNRDRMLAWEEGIRHLKSFRQGPDVGRNGRNGRSRWPEADSLRAHTGRGEPMHATSITIPSPAMDAAFPRAEFGLPIVEKFHYQQTGDHPNNCTIYPLDSERMASPLIIKALAVYGGALPIVLRLFTQVPAEVRVEFETLPEWYPTGAHVRRADLSVYPNSPMAKRTPSGSALGAFLNFLKEPGRDFKVIF